MTPDDFLYLVIDKCLLDMNRYLGLTPTDDVRRFMLCVALQESGPDLDARYQNSPATDPGPARGWWQFEQGDATSRAGVYGVMTHKASGLYSVKMCDIYHVVPDPACVWRALEGHDMLAGAFARLLMLTDPWPVPNASVAGWECYCDRLWRPGKPHPETWPTNWQTATNTVQPKLI